jgi:fucose permease
MPSHTASDDTDPLLSQPSTPTSIHHNGSYQPDAPASIKDGDVLEEKERGWGLTLRIGAAMYSFVVLGLFGSSIGVVLRPIRDHYQLSDTLVSLIFLVNPIGYIAAAYSNSFVHNKFGQRGIATLGPISHVLAAVLISARLPFPFLLIGYVVVGLGTGWIDGSWCAWAASMPRANTISGFLHGSFSIGAAAGPLLSGTMLANQRHWWEWYYILFFAALIELLVLGLAFRFENSSRYHRSKEASLLFGSTFSSKEILKYRATWFSAAYFLADVGVETAISGWVVVFVGIERHANTYLAAFSSSGFWAGMAAGRLLLGSLTDRVGVRRATGIYLFLATVLEVLFAVVHGPVVSVVLMTIVGFLMGPLFPSGVVVLTSLLPKELHVTAVSFVASIGQVGGALLPFGVGAVVDGLGIRVFKYAIVVFSVLALILWVVFARLRPNVEYQLCAGEDEDEERTHSYEEDRVLASG